MSDSLLRIVISTDNHLGYQEKDPVRGNDSFAAFEEVLAFAKWKEADLVLLGGDVFHENKPSRVTLHSTFDILREYVMGDESVMFQILSDQGKCLEGRRKQVNYEDPHFSVGLPIFSIHGNHDDPTRERGGESFLAALDLLQVTNYVNYFGKQDQVDNVCVKPILLSKGQTKVALYGLGNVRDERLNRMWTKQKVTFLRPTEAEGRDTFVNILVLHQNRAVGRGRKNAIYESMIPEWFDIVVWGHEHQSFSEFQAALGDRFYVLQPGSTVATSLVEGEADTKHVAVLEIRGQQYRLQSYPLQNVRQFVTDEVRLDDEEFGLDPEDTHIDAAIDSVLESKVREMIDRGKSRTEDVASQDWPSNKLYQLRNKDQVLVRLKVDRTGFPTINSQRFGARFVGTVANPSEIILFHQKRRVDESSKSHKFSSSSTLTNPVEADEIPDLSVEDLIAEQLDVSDKKLQLLKQADLKIALEDYVMKQNSSAISDLVERVLDTTQKRLRASRAGTNGEVKHLEANESDDDKVPPPRTRKRAAPPKAPPNRPTRKSAVESSFSSENSESDQEEEEEWE